MSQASHRDVTLLDDLELRQNEVLDQLDDLERRVEHLLNEFLTTRNATTIAEA